MKRINQMLAVAGMGAAMLFGGDALQAQQDRQGRGNFDPEQLRARMAERIREQMEVKNDDEWQIIEERINKVNEARRDAAVSSFGGFGRGGFGRGRGQGDASSAGQGGPRGGGQGGGRGGFFGGPPNPDMEALQKALDDNASPEELKSRMAKVRESQKKNQAALEKAQKELKEVLNTRQEAVAVVMGLLP